MGKASRQKRIRDQPARTERAKGQPTTLPVRTADDTTASWVHWLALASLPVLCALIYYPSLTGQFVFDDHNAIQQSLLVRKIFPLSRFIKSNRFLVDFTYALNYAQGAYDTWWYHCTNILIHIATSLTLYWLALRTFHLPILAEKIGTWAQPAAWVAALLFAGHPLATEGVSYVSSRSEILAGLFYLLAIVAYSLAVTDPDAGTRRAAKGALIATTALGLASKEIAVTIPLALLLYDFIFLAGGEWKQIQGRWSTMALSLIPLLLGGGYLLARADSLSTPYQQSAGFGFDRYTPIEYLSTQFGAIVRYLRLLVVPTGLNFDYDWKLVRSPFSASAVLPLLLLAVWVGLALRSIRSYPLFAFFVLFMLLVLAPTSSIMPLADLVVERRMYIPITGFALFAAGAGAILARRFSDNLAAFIAPMLAIVAVFSGLTYQRAAIWGDHLVLYEDGVAKSPGNPRVRLNLGVIHMNAGRHDKAHEVLFEAKRVYDEGKSIHAFPRIGAFIHYNLGAIQFIRKEYDDSETQMRRALEIGGHYVALRPRAYSVIAHIHKLRGEWKEAELAFREALKHNRDYPDWRFALAETLVEQGRFGDANVALYQLYQIEPEAESSDRAVALRKRIAELKSAKKLTQQKTTR